MSETKLGTRANIVFQYNNGRGELRAAVKMSIPDNIELTTTPVTKYVGGMLAYKGYRNINHLEISLEEFVAK